MGEGVVFSICRQIYQAETLSATDKLLGLVLAVSKVKDKDFARLSLAKIMARTSLSERAIQRSVKKLESAGILHRVRTGRAAIYRFDALCGVKSGDIVEADSVASQTRHTDAADDQAAHVEPPRELTKEELSLGRYTAVALSKWGENWE